ncbi:MAG: hypothetical protein J0I79_16470 [Mesorhizobium sp.]|uniref:hypothetical protein n=1 Tax=Mesorhizobium sp. TaxID=1871066 RepID=UPI001ACB2148|nr:hypothetical protein [Mesorhizobium sp.]MBN9219541.1 hypothetical protein [Mesorhizobium sp.]
MANQTLFVSPQARNDPAYIQLLAQSLAMLNNAFANLSGGGGTASGTLVLGGLASDELGDDTITILGMLTADEFA